MLRLGVVRTQAQRFVIMRQCLVDLALFAQHVAEVVMGLGQIGTLPQRFLVAHPRFVESVQIAQDESEIDPRLDVVRLNLQTAAISGFGLGLLILA